MLPISDVVPAMVKLLVEVRVSDPRAIPTFPVNVRSPLFPNDVWAVEVPPMVIFRPSAAVSVNFPADTDADTPVVLDCALTAAARAPLESFVSTVTAPMFVPLMNKSPEASVPDATESVKVRVLDSTVALTPVVDLIPLIAAALANEEDWPL